MYTESIKSGFEVVGATFAREFAGALHVQHLTEVLIRLTVAVVLAAALGYERERRMRSAGFRTHMMVGLGAATFVLLPSQLAFSDNAIARIVEGVIVGVGFLGAGAILKLNDQQRIHGLTTAGSIWATAAVGVAAGIGQEVTALIVAGFAFIILSWLQRVERRFDFDKEFD